MTVRHIFLGSPIPTGIRLTVFIFCGNEIVVHAFLAWFDITFACTHKKVQFSTGPHAKYTHWKYVAPTFTPLLMIASEPAFITYLCLVRTDKRCSILLRRSQYPKASRSREHSDVRRTRKTTAIWISQYHMNAETRGRISNIRCPSTFVLSSLVL